MCQHFPGGSDGKASACNVGDLGSIPASGRSPGEGNEWHPTPVLLPGKSHGQRSLVACTQCVAKSRTRLSDFTFTFNVPETILGIILVLSHLTFTTNKRGQYYYFDHFIEEESDI